MPFLIFLAFFSFYSYSAHPTLSGGDSGEMSATINSLGLAHPTGFPLYIITAKVFSLFLPISDAAYKFNLYSSFLTAASVTLLFLVLINLGISSTASFFATSIFGFGKTIWAHAGATSVYPISLLFIVILLWIFTKWLSDRQMKYLYWYLFIWGVSFGTHALTITMVAPLVQMLWQIRKSLNFKKISTAALLLLVPFLQYLYLPWAYARNTIAQFGKVDNFGGFIEYVTQRDYANKIATRGVEGINIFINKTVTLFLSEFTIIFFIISIIGLWILFKKRLGLFLPLVSIIVINLTILLSYGNSQDIYNLYRYFYPSYVIFAIGIAIIINSFLSKIGQSNRNTFLAILILAIIIFFQARSSWVYNYEGNDYIVSDFANNILETAENDSLILTAGDIVTGPLWYSQSVGKRTDLKIINVDLLSWDWYVKNEAKRNPDVVDIGLLDIKGNNKSEQRAIELIRKNIRDRTIYSIGTEIAGITDKNVTKEFDVWPVGILYQVTTKNTVSVNDLLKVNNKAWSRYTLRRLKKELYKDPYEQDLPGVYSIALTNLGVIYLRNGLNAEAKDAFLKALGLDPNNPRRMQNLKLVK